MVEATPEGTSYVARIHLMNGKTEDVTCIPQPNQTPEAHYMALLDQLAAETSVVFVRRDLDLIGFPARQVTHIEGIGIYRP